MSNSAPYIHSGSNVQQMMLQVLLALAPGILAMLYYFGFGVFLNLLTSVITALAVEAMVLKIRKRPVVPVLMDGSALVTAVLLAICLPTLAPWWLVVTGAAFAILFGKHLYGGLGQNPFNPAMLAYVALLIGFPAYMSHWIAPYVVAEQELTMGEHFYFFFNATLPEGVLMDAVTMATPLDYMKSELSTGATVNELLFHPGIGSMGATGWEWVSNFFIIGGGWLIYRRIIDWRIPVSLLAGLLITSSLMYPIDMDVQISPLMHLFSGGVMLAAFFIATDPVTASTTAKGRLIFGFMIGVLIYLIRTWGNYPDGIAFAVLLMNMMVPVIDQYTRPKSYGH